VEFDVIVVTQSRRNPALSVFGRRLLQGVLGDDENPACLGKLNGRAQTCNSSANYQEIAGKLLVGIR
jgi:hypothetical protein